jgi:hypothetical protein
MQNSHDLQGLTIEFKTDTVVAHPDAVAVGGKLLGIQTALVQSP